MSRTRHTQAVACLALGLFAAAPGMAQEAATPGTDQNKAAAREITSEVLSSTAPAFAALGVSGQTITDPESLKTAAFALLNGTDVDGKPLTGIGLQFAPAQLVPGLSVDYNDYRTNWSKRAFARLQITGAYTRAEANNGLKPERAAIGAIWVPFDTTDPFVNTKLDKCVNLAHEKNELPIGPAPVGTGQITNPALKSALAACRNQFVQSATRGFSSQIGLAKLFRRRDGGTGPIVGAGFAASAVVSVGLDCLFSKPCGAPNPNGSHIGGKLLLGAVVRERELIANPLDAKKFIDRNRQSFGGKLVVGNARAWWLGFEFLSQHASYQGLGSDNYTTYSASLDIKVSKGLWLAANYADSSGENFGKSSQFTAGLKFALQPSSSIGGGSE